MNFQFYLDKPFLPKVDKPLVQRLVKEGKNVNKYLNPNDTSIYAWLSFPGGHYIKVNTSERIAARWWDFKIKKPRRVMAGSATLSDRLEDLKHQILKGYRTLISINPHPTLDEIRESCKGCGWWYLTKFQQAYFFATSTINTWKTRSHQ